MAKLTKKQLEEIKKILKKRQRLDEIDPSSRDIPVPIPPEEEEIVEEAG